MGQLKKIIRVIIKQFTPFRDFFKMIVLYMPGTTGAFIRCKYFKKKFKKYSRFISNPGLVISCPENVEIGENCAFNYNVFIGAAGGKIILGNNVLVAPNVVMRCVNKKYDRLDISIAEQGNKYGKIIVKDDCWIGSNCTLLSGTILNEGSIVGANSVINKEYPPYSVIVGAPGRVISNRKLPSD